MNFILKRTFLLPVTIPLIILGSSIQHIILFLEIFENCIDWILNKFLDL